MYLDIIIIIILLIGLFIGINDGFIVQFFSLFGIILNFAIANKLTPILMEKFDLVSSGEYYIFVYIGTFVVTYIIITLIVSLIKIVFKAKNEGFISKALGGLFGLVKTLIITLLLLFIANNVAAKYSKFEKYVDESKINQIFIKEIYHTEDHLPNEIMERLKKIKDSALIKKHIG